MKSVFAALSLVLISQTAFATTDLALYCQMTTGTEPQFGFLVEKTIALSVDGTEVNDRLVLGRQSCNVRFRQADDSQDGFIQIKLSNAGSGNEQVAQTSFDIRTSQRATTSYLKTENSSCYCKLQQ